jgi:hypothetical protein
LAYERRIASVTACALDDEAITRVFKNFSAAGFAVDRPRMLSLKQSGTPGGWVPRDGPIMLHERWPALQNCTNVAQFCGALARSLSFSIRS